MLEIENEYRTNHTELLYRYLKQKKKTKNNNTSRTERKTGTAL